MHTEARNRGTMRNGGDGFVFQIDRIADLCDAAAIRGPEATQSEIEALYSSGSKGLLSTRESVSA